MKRLAAIVTLTMIGAAVAQAQQAPSNTDRPGSALPAPSAAPSSSALSQQQGASKEMSRPLRSQLQAAKPGEASAKAAPPQPTAFGSQ
jgi:hypothetical protein